MCIAALRYHVAHYIHCDLLYRAAETVLGSSSRRQPGYCQAGLSALAVLMVLLSPAILGWEVPPWLRAVRCRYRGD